MALAFAVFTHLPSDALRTALENARIRFPRLRAFLLTVFLAPAASGPHRQADGVVTHPDRPPYHLTEAALRMLADDAGFDIALRDTVLPRGQRLFVATPRR